MVNYYWTDDCRRRKRITYFESSRRLDNLRIKNRFRLKSLKQFFYGDLYLYFKDIKDYIALSFFINKYENKDIMWISDNQIMEKLL